MISCTALKDSQSLLDNALRLLSLEPLSVLDSDLVEKEVYKSYHLFAADAHGIFGTASLSERPSHTLSENFKKTLMFYEQKTYYELSLVYAKPPHFLETLKTEDKKEQEALMTRYYCLFYRELYDFLRAQIHDAPLVVHTTEEELEKMSLFGLWSFQDIFYRNGSVQGTLSFPTELPLKNKTTSLG